MAQFVFSLNGENWSGAFDTRNTALAAAIQKCSGAADPPGTVFVGEMAGESAHVDGLGKVLVNELRARGNDHLRDVSTVQISELDGTIERVVIAWLLKHKMADPSSKVEAISEHLTPVPHLGLGKAQVGSEVQDLGSEN